MSQLNHTPLDDETLRILGEGIEALAATAPQQPTTVRVSPESPPIQLQAKEQNQPEVTENRTPETESAPEASTQPQTYIEEKPEHIELPPELQKLGLKSVKQDDFPDYRNVKLPISDEKVMVGSNAPMNSSMRWLAEFAKFLLWKAHITLKTVHGRVVRIVKK